MRLKVKNTKIKETDWGVACKIGGIVYLNKHLKKHPKLYEAILKHEKEHTDGYDWRDIRIDMQGKYLKPVKKEYYKFILTHPKSLINFLPFWKYDKTFTIDPIQIIFWVLAATLILACLLITI